MKIKLCACSSGKLFDQCCRPFLEKTKIAKTPQQLMRSRYSAFALGGYGDYLLDTWSVSSSAGSNAAELSVASINWQQLDIIDKSSNGDRGMVEFKAYFLDHDGERHVHHEISQFQRLSGKWIYTDGEVLS